MSGECDECGEHVMDCECFPRAQITVRKGAWKKADGWQPINTAPKDGTQILFYGKRRPFDILPGGGDCIVIATWSTVSSEFNAPKEWLGATHMNVDFTHWMPLPVPPASADTLPKGQDAEERLDAKQG